MTYIFHTFDVKPRLEMNYCPSLIINLLEKRTFVIEIIGIILNIGRHIEFSEQALQGFSKKNEKRLKYFTNSKFFFVK